MEELVTAEILWISIRAGVYGMAPLLVGFAFGLSPTWGMLLVPHVSSGSSPASASPEFGVVIAAVGEDDRQLQLRHQCTADTDVPGRRHLLPDRDAPAGACARSRRSNPLYHCVALVRDVSLSIYRPADFVHLAVLLAFALLMWRLAIWRLQARLID